MNRRLFYMFLIRLTSDTEQPASDIQIRDFIKHIFIEIIEEGRKNTEGKAKVVAAGWGRILEYRTYHLAARLMFWRNVLGKTSPFGGCVLVFIHSFKASFPPSSRYYIHPFFKSSWWKTASAAMNWINSIPPSSSNNLCLFIGIYPSSVKTTKYRWNGSFEKMDDQAVRKQGLSDVDACSPANIVHH